MILVHLSVDLFLKNHGLMLGKKILNLRYVDVPLGI